MPHWTNEPPRDQITHALPIRRTPVHGPLVGIITSEDILGCDTHYWHSRTLPCERPDCPACNEGYPYRWHAYCSVWCPKPAAHIVLELTVQPTEPLLLYRRAQGSLRGCLIEVSRSGSRPNGRVLLRCKPADLTRVQLPSAPNLRSVLAIIWNIAQPAVTGITRANWAPADASPDAPRGRNGEPSRITIPTPL